MTVSRVWIDSKHPSIQASKHPRSWTMKHARMAGASTVICVEAYVGPRPSPDAPAQRSLQGGLPGRRGGSRSTGPACMLHQLVWLLTSCNSSPIKNGQIARQPWGTEHRGQTQSQGFYFLGLIKKNSREQNGRNRIFEGMTSVAELRV